jgi:hypothetical protein
MTRRYMSNKKFDATRQGTPFKLNSFCYASPDGALNFVPERVRIMQSASFAGYADSRRLRNRAPQM